MKPGYAYHFTGDGSWSDSPSDDWDTESQGGGKAEYLGTRQIDGEMCTVWKHRGEVFAQLAHMAPAPSGGAKGGKPRTRWSDKMVLESVRDHEMMTEQATERARELGELGFIDMSGTWKLTEKGVHKISGKKAKSAGPAITVLRVKLDRGGYDARGRYFGVGAPLWSYESDDGDSHGHVRAKDKAAAKAEVRKLYATARVK